MSSHERASSSHSRTPLPTNLRGYEVTGLIGRGAGSNIYKAKQSDTGRVVALKHVVRKKEKEIRYIEQLQREHEVCRRISHAGLRRTFELKIRRTLLRRRVTEGLLVMEYFEGRSMDARLPVPVADLTRWFIDTARAMSALHQMGYVHCDLKPSNILIGHGAQVKIIDFGQACTSGTVKVRIQGTPDFMSPEQVRRRPISFRTDVFSLGATLYWALTHQKVPTLFAARRSSNSFLVEEKMRFPHELDPGIPRALSNFTMECVKVREDKRPQDMAEVVHRLETIEHGLKRLEKA